MLCLYTHPHHAQHSLLLTVAKSSHRDFASFGGKEKGREIISTGALIVDLDFLLLWLLVFFFALFRLCCLVSLLRTQPRQNHCSLSFLTSFLSVNVRSCIYHLPFAYFTTIVE